MSQPNKSDQRVVFVTGATTGIGLALTKRLLKTSMRLVLTARASSLSRFQQEGIEESDSVMIRPLDVTRGEQANAVAAEVLSRWGGVDVLVNNAGVAYRAVMEHLEDRDEEDQFHINYLGPLHLIRLVIPGMRARRSGHIINLSSVGGMMAMPTMGGYSASKFALEGASEALWYEMRPWGISVTLVEPGFVHSSSFKNAVFTLNSRKAYENQSEDYHPYYVNMLNFITKMMHFSPTTPDDIACKIIRIMNRKNPPLRAPVTPDAIFFSIVRRLLPARIYHWLLYRSLPNLKTWVTTEKTQNQ